MAFHRNAPQTRHHTRGDSHLIVSDRDNVCNWVHVSGCRAGSDCVFYQEGKGKFDFKPAEASGTKPGK
jgi:hypothetical protein